MFIVALCLSCLFTLSLSSLLLLTSLCLISLRLLRLSSTLRWPPRRCARPWGPRRCAPRPFVDMPVPTDVLGCSSMACYQTCFLGYSSLWPMLPNLSSIICVYIYICIYIYVYPSLSLSIYIHIHNIYIYMYTSYMCNAALLVRRAGVRGPRRAGLLLPATAKTIIVMYCVMYYIYIYIYIYIL